MIGNVTPCYDAQIMAGQTAKDAVAFLPRILEGRYTEFTIYVTFDGTAAAGAVVLETAPSSDYQGTWANIGTVTFSAASKCHYISVTGVFKTVRVRISSAVTSGTVDVYAVCTMR